MNCTNLRGSKIIFQIEFFLIMIYPNFEVSKSKIKKNHQVSILYLPLQCPWFRMIWEELVEALEVDECPLQHEFLVGLPFQLADRLLFLQLWWVQGRFSVEVVGVPGVLVEEVGFLLEYLLIEFAQLISFFGFLPFEVVSWKSTFECFFWFLRSPDNK